ncbi:hypothetical protein FKM82_014280 [Ascaphus truei]
MGFLLCTDPPPSASAAASPPGADKFSCRSWPQPPQRAARAACETGTGGGEGGGMLPCCTEDSADFKLQAWVNTHKHTHSDLPPVAPDSSPPHWLTATPRDASTLQNTRGL